MPAELPETGPNLASVRCALSDLRGAHNDFVAFVGSELDQLESLSLELFARHKCLELSAQHDVEKETASAERESHWHECLEHLRDLKTEICSARDETVKIRSEISTTREQAHQEHPQLHEAQQELLRISAELRAMRQGIEQDRGESRQQQERVEQLLHQLAAVVAESAAAPPTAAGNDQQLTAVLETARQQQATWQQDRASLEAELKAERQRAAQQDEVVAEHRRLAAEQQAELSGELKRMRSLLEFLSSHMNQPTGGNSGDGKPTASPSENAALESMLAQFEMLQHDLAQRRSNAQKEPKEAAKVQRTT